MAFSLANLKYPLFSVAAVGGLGTGIYLMSLSSGGDKAAKLKKDVPSNNAQLLNDQPQLNPQPKQPVAPLEGSIGAKSHNQYQSNSTGGQFGNYLLDTEGSSDVWNKRKQEIDKATVESGLFKTAQRRDGGVQLKTSCKSMYTIEKEKWFVTGTEGTYTDKDRQHLWQDTWTYCSVTGKEQDKPEDWPYKNGK